MTNCESHGHAGASIWIIIMIFIALGVRKLIFEKICIYLIKHLFMSIKILE